MQQNVALADGGEQILLARAAPAPPARRTAGRAVPANGCLDTTSSAASGFSGPSTRYKSCSVRCRVSSSASRMGSGQSCVDFQPHGVAAPAFVQFRSSTALSRFGMSLLVHVKLAVAREAERPAAENSRAGKQVGEKMSDELAEKNIVAPVVVARQLDEARQNRAGIAPRPDA